jgi:hypothetical protein
VGFCQTGWKTTTLNSSIHFQPLHGRSVNWPKSCKINQPVIVQAALRLQPVQKVLLWFKNRQICRFLNQGKTFETTPSARQVVEKRTSGKKHYGQNQI